MILGIDASNNNGSIDCTTAAKGGFHFAFFKATEGATWHDPTFATNIKNAKAARLLTGAYGFARPATSKAVDEANTLLAAIKSVGGVDLPPMLDMEDAGGLTNAQLIKWCSDWCDVISTATGRLPILYASSSFIRKHELYKIASIFDLFIADYTTASVPDLGGWTRPWVFWQHTQTGRLPGHAGSVDLDYFNGTLEELKTYCKGVSKTEYTHFKVFVGIEGQPEHEFDAIAVGDVTYVSWPAAEALGSKVENPYKNGTLLINGKLTKCVIDNGSDYVSWGDMAQGVQAHKRDGLWHFTVAPKPQPLPDMVNLWQWHGPIHNQGSQGACAGETAVELREWYQVKQGWPQPFVKGSPEAAYSWARIKEGDLNKDAGSWLRDTLWSLVTYGMAPDGDDVMDAQDEFAVPSQKAVQDATQFKITGYTHLDFEIGNNSAAPAIAKALADGDPVGVAATYNTSFGNLQPGGVVDHTKGTTLFNEGHAFIILGYADGSYFGATDYAGQRLYAAQNSWGTGYGIKLPGTDTAGFMLLTEETINQLVYAAFTIDLPNH